MKIILYISHSQFQFILENMLKTRQFYDIVLIGIDPLEITHN
jgi:hypothetical protein